MGLVLMARSTWVGVGHGQRARPGRAALAWPGRGRRGFAMAPAGVASVLSWVLTSDFTTQRLPRRSSDVGGRTLGALEVWQRTGLGRTPSFGAGWFAGELAAPPWWSRSSSAGRRRRTGPCSPPGPRRQHLDCPQLSTHLIPFPAAFPPFLRRRDVFWARRQLAPVNLSASAPPRLRHAYDGKITAEARTGK